MFDERGDESEIEFETNEHIGSTAIATAWDTTLGLLLGLGAGATLFFAVDWWHASLGSGALLPAALIGLLVGGAAVGMIAGRRLRPHARARHHVLLRGLQRSADERIDELRRETPVVRCAEAAQGIVRVRGRVRVLDPAEGAAPRVGAVLGARRACGRFLVVDESGAAVVDDDMFEIWPSDLLDAVIEDGDLVEIVGSGRRQRVPGLTGRGFRDTADALVFEGSKERKVHIIRVARADGRAPVRTRVAIDTEPEQAELTADRSGERSLRR